MKHLFLIFTASLLLSFTTEWQTIAINEHIKVSMPSKPNPEVKNGNTMHSLILPDSAKLLSGAIDLSQLGLGEEQITALAPSDEFKAQFKQGLETQGIKILKEEYGQFKGMTFYQFAVEKSAEGKVTPSVMRALFYKHYLIQLTYTPGMKGEDNALKNQFFTSLQVQ